MRTKYLNENKNILLTQKILGQRIRVVKETACRAAAIRRRGCKSHRWLLSLILNKFCYAYFMVIL